MTNHSDQLDSELTHLQTAQILGISTRQLYNVVRQGRLFPIDRGARQAEMRFRPDEVYALLSVKSRGLDLADTTNLAVQAHALSRATMRRLDRLVRFMGLEINRLDYNEDAVYHLHLKAKNALNSDLAGMSFSNVMDWATTLNAIDESYLRIVEEYTLDQSPWSTYLTLANAVFDQTPVSVIKAPSTSAAYACLDVARKSLRRAAYFYVHTKHGATIADDVFTEGIDEEIIGHLYPAPIGPI